MRIKKEVVLRKAAGEAILVPVGDTVFEYNGVFTLNPAAECLWRAVEAGKEGEQLLRALTEEFDVSEAEARADIRDFLNKLSSFGII